MSTTYSRRSQNTPGIGLPGRVWRKAAKGMRRARAAASRIRFALERRLPTSAMRERLGLVKRGGLDWELDAVIEGQKKNRRELQARSGKGAEYTLRRNLHRIEKGLIMRPMRSVFARDYIVETCQVFEQLAKAGNRCPELLSWGGSVLARYFDAVDRIAVTEEARVSFEGGMKALGKACTGKDAPYRRDLSPLRITIDDMQQLALRRRSVRWFLPEPPPRDLIDRAIDVARYSPSACNRQPFRFMLFDDKEMVQRVAGIPMGTAGLYHNFPCVCVMVGDLSAFPEERDRHVPYIDASLAAMAFEFALEVQGIASCSINWPEIAGLEKKMSDTLRLEPYERPIMLIAYGWPDPDGQVPFSQKMPIEQIRSYNSTLGGDAR